MSDEEKFNLVLHAGNAESSALMAIEAAREGRFDEASELRDEAKTELHTAHRMQTDLLSRCASGEDVAVDIMLVHAQDHLSMASVLTDVAGEMISLHADLHNLTGRIDAVERVLAASENKEEE